MTDHWGVLGRLNRNHRWLNIAALLVVRTNAKHSKAFIKITKCWFQNAFYNFHKSCFNSSEHKNSIRIFLIVVTLILTIQRFQNKQLQNWLLSPDFHVVLKATPKDIGKPRTVCVDMTMRTRSNARAYTRDEPSTRNLTLSSLHNRRY